MTTETDLKQNPTANFTTKLETVGIPEQVKFDNNDIWHKHEAYIHFPNTKYPQATSLYLKDGQQLEEGMYSISCEMFMVKGKVQSRMIYTPAKVSPKPVSTPNK